MPHQLPADGGHNLVTGEEDRGDSRTEGGLMEDCTGRRAPPVSCAAAALRGRGGVGLVVRTTATT
jgi:hypothetical protein